jgi:hypothetical protein
MLLIDVSTIMLQLYGRCVGVYVVIGVTFIYGYEYEKERYGGRYVFWVLGLIRLV